MKRGWKTSEFWLSAISVVVGLLLASGAFGEGSDAAKVLGFVSSALAAMGYSASRGMVKSSEAKAAALVQASSPN